MKPGPLKASPGDIAAFARKVVPEHETFLSEGYQLVGKSGLWLTRRGDITGRFVYRKPGFTIAFTIRKIGVEWA